MNITQIPGTTDLGGPTPVEIQKQLSRVIHSKVFRHASALQRLLQYLVSRAVEDPFGGIKEYTIGVEVFERGSGYDPQIDTVVRVQIHRLRQKIKEYYESEGANDPIIVEIPKGHYIPAFESRADALVKAGEPEAERHLASEVVTNGGGVAPAAGLDSAGTRSAESGRTWSRSRVATIGCVVGMVFAAGIFLGGRWIQLGGWAKNDESSSRGGVTSFKSDDAVGTFWKSFLGNDTAPVVGYADAVFLVDSEGDLLRFRRGASDNRGTAVDPHLAREFASNPALVEKAGPLFYEDGYTGTGDVESIFTLTRLFTSMGTQMTVKRCRLVTIDDLKEHNVILLGSPDQNDAVAQLPQVSDFVFENPAVQTAWGGLFLNRHPQPGESLEYYTERDPVTREVKSDYGLITVQPGAVPGRYIAILGGLDTSGVAGTAQFMSSPTQMAELRQRLETLGAWKANGPMPAFQALLRVDVEKGNDVLAVHLISVHIAQPEKTEAEAEPVADAR
jgi:hypothetical protein